MGTVIQMPPRRIRPLTHIEAQLLSRALETWAWRARKEAAELDKIGSADESAAFITQADKAQDLIDRLSWLRVTA